MKIREIGHKIGDIDVPIPDDPGLKRFLILSTIIVRVFYRVLFWLGISMGVWVFGIGVYRGISRSDGFSGDVAMRLSAGIGIMVLTLFVNWIVKFIISTYKYETKQQ